MRHKTKTSIQEEPFSKSSNTTFETPEESNVGNWSSDENDKICHLKNQTKESTTKD